VKELFKIRDVVKAIGTMFVKDKVGGMVGKLEWHAIDKDGNRVEGYDGHTHNLVVDAGKTLAASRLVANTNAAITHFGVGTGTTAVAAGQTALVTQTARVAVDSATNSSNVVTVVATVPAGTATGTIEEIGLFNASSSGTMIARALTGTISKPAGLGLVFTWTITVG
jgi:hypothetical protein